MIKNPFKSLKKHDFFLWGISLFVVTLSNFVSGEISPFYLIGTLIGVTALIFIAKGDVWGQILTVVFSIFYAISSYSFCYYGEMITYLGMTMPIAMLSIITWLKHPYDTNKNEVKIHKLTKKQALFQKPALKPRK